MTLSRRENGAPRPARGSVHPASAWSPLPGRRIAALLREIRSRGWASVLDRIAPDWARRAICGVRRRSPSRTFYPTLDGGLEGRMLLTKWHVIPKVLANSAYLLKHPSARTAFLKNFPPQVQNQPLKHQVGQITRRRFVAATQTARGGQAVEVTALDGSHYMIRLDYTSNTIATNTAEGSNGQGGNSSSATATSLVSQQNGNYPQPIGTVRAYAMPGGRVGIIVDGSTANTELTINPLGQRQYKGFAHSFAYGESTRNHLLNVGQLTVTSGQIGAIEGFQDTMLSGPLTVPGTAPVNRIAFAAILPGASITTGGDLQTLDVLNNIDLSGPGTGITIGRDLNLLNVGTGITLSNGANVLVGRNLGLIPQPPKGTGTGTNVLSLNFTQLSNTISSINIPSVGSFIQGSIAINPGSVFGIGGLIYATMYVEGNVSGYSRLFELYGTAGQTNPPFLTQLPTVTTNTNGTTNAPPSTQSGPAPYGYVTALQGVIP
jgi:hypothetical protein